MDVVSCELILKTSRGTILMPRRISNKKRVKEQRKQSAKLILKCQYINHVIDSFENDWGCCKRCSEWVHVTDFIRGIKQL